MQKREGNAAFICAHTHEFRLSAHTHTHRVDSRSDTDAGILSGKAGVMYCHIGTGPGLLDPLWKVVKETDVPISAFLPTHMERSEVLIDDGAKWVKQGGYVDFTCRTLKVRLAILSDRKLTHNNSIFGSRSLFKSAFASLTFVCLIVCVNDAVSVGFEKVRARGNSNGAGDGVDRFLRVTTNF